MSRRFSPLGRQFSDPQRHLPNPANLHYFEGCQNLVSFDYAGLNDPTNILDLTGTTYLISAF